MKNRSFYLLLIGLLSLAPSFAKADDTGETPQQRDARMQWWKEARFGMFIHWGLYAVPAGRWSNGKVDVSYSGGIGEWIQHDAKISVADYAKLANQFNPTLFDADAWVATAKAAGMKYIVITAKHHDGFAMFRTKVTPFNIVDATPFKRDPVAELAAACKKQGIRFGVYYSQAQDWHHPGGYKAGGSWDPAQKGDYDAYLRDIAIPQVKELMSNYGPISVVWWDTPFDMTTARAKPLGDLLNLQPSIISNDRLGSNVQADYATPEQHIPPNGYGGRPWETCMTINDTWGYKVDDKNFKSTKTLLHNLIDIASKGGNYLLNVGPDARGIIPEGETDRLKEIGTWLNINGAALYGTSAGPFLKQLPFGLATRKDNKLFLSVFDWPKDGKLWLPLSTKITKAYLLTAPSQPLEIASVDGGNQITVTGDAPDPIASVIVLELDGPPQAFMASIHPAADGSITLGASDATIDGQTAQVESKDGVANIGYWTNSHDSAHWNCDGIAAGTYKVGITYACDPSAAGSQFEITAGDGKITGEVDATASWENFKKLQLGTITVTSAGKVTFTIKPTNVPNGAVMNLRSIRLVPG